MNKHLYIEFLSDTRQWANNFHELNLNYLESISILNKDKVSKNCFTRIDTDFIKEEFDHLTPHFINEEHGIPEGLILEGFKLAKLDELELMLSIHDKDQQIDFDAAEIEINNMNYEQLVEFDIANFVKNKLAKEEIIDKKLDNKTNETIAVNKKAVKRNLADKEINNKKVKLED